MEHPVRADDVSDILYEGTEIGLFFRDYGWVCRYSVDGEEFAAVADFFAVGGINKIQHNIIS